MNKIKSSPVFFYYEFEPFLCYSEGALYEFLLDEVWSDLADPTEDVSPQRCIFDNDLIGQIRYQFPDYEQAYDRYAEVGLLLANAVEKWKVTGAWRE